MICPQSPYHIGFVQLLSNFNYLNFFKTTIAMSLVTAANHQVGAEQRFAS